MLRYGILDDYQIKLHTVQITESSVLSLGHTHSVNLVKPISTCRKEVARANDQDPSALARRLFDCATVNGAESIGFAGGKLEPGLAADFFTIDLNDTSIAGASADELLASTVFSSSRTAVRDVVVAGKRIVENGRHADQAEIVESFKILQKKLWG